LKKKKAKTIPKIKNTTLQEKNEEVDSSAIEYPVKEKTEKTILKIKKQNEKSRDNVRRV
jgi:hypothetical protein